MKKNLFAVFLCVGLLMFAGGANAVLFTDTVDVGALYGADAAGRIWQGYAPVTYTWEHSTPADFEVPWDVVNSATISIYVGWVDTFGDDHFDVGTLTLPLDQNTDTYSLDIGSLFFTWPNGQNLSASLTIYEDELAAGLPDWGGDIILGDSVFTLDYENAAAPVPEPATMLLLGSGLVGLVGFGRRKFFKK